MESPPPGSRAAQLDKLMADIAKIGAQTMKLSADNMQVKADSDRMVRIMLVSLAVAFSVIIAMIIIAVRSGQ